MEVLNVKKVKVSQDFWAEVYVLQPSVGSLLTFKAAQTR